MHQLQMQPAIADTDPMLDVALSFIAQHWPVFPCRHRDDEYVDNDGCVEILATKTPLTSNGFRGATLNERIVREYWRRNPSAMIGVPTGALIGAWVLDIDPKHGGDETLAALEQEYGALPATLTAETTSGGRHYFFRHRQGVRNRGALGSGVYVRGDGGYVIAAGSVPELGLPYRWIAEQEPVDAPDWLLDLVLPRSYESTYTAAPSVSGKINDRYVERAVQSELDDLALEPMGNRNNRLNDNTRLVDISRMIANGLAKAEAGADVEEQQLDADLHLSISEPEQQIENKRAIIATPFVWKDPSTLPRREFAFGKHFIRKYVSVTVAPGGFGKTANSIVEALAMASGKALNGTKPPKRLKVRLFNAEDPRDELERRIMAACIHFNLKPADIDGHLFLDTSREQELVIAIDDKKGVRIQEPVVEAVVETISVRVDAPGQRKRQWRYRQGSQALGAGRWGNAGSTASYYLTTGAEPPVVAASIEK